jgi:hypothetical protein
MTTGPLVLDPLLGPAGADEVVRIWHDFGSYGQYSNEGFDTQLAPALPQRYDARENFVRTGGRFKRDAEDPGLLGARTNYFRETYAYGDETFAGGVDVLMHHDGLLDAARKVHGRDVVVPAILYANILLPGQELAVHTDVPEFRGANRKVVPQWLLVVMHHSGLFDAWRMPIATAITYFGEGERGGELAYYVDGEAHTYSPRHDTAVVLDTDTVFHGVDRVLGDESALSVLRSGQRLHHDGGGEWSLRARDGETVLARFGTDDLRYSVSWKGYCFADDAERDAWANHTDDLTLDHIIATLLDDLGVERPSDDVELGKLLIDRYVVFPG